MGLSLGCEGFLAREKNLEFITEPDAPLYQCFINAKRWLNVAALFTWSQGLQVWGFVGGLLLLKKGIEIKWVG